MRSTRKTRARAFALAAAGIVAMAVASRPAQALTLIRAGLDDLVAANATVVVATVEGAKSYWNRDASFILTDYRLRATKVLKGRVDGELALTLMGGTAGDMTTLIPGGAALEAGRSYLLFLRDEPLPGTEAVTTVAEHCQGVFDLEDRDGVLWATSQAAGEALIPDEEDPKDGVDVPGGIKGMSLDELTRSIEELVRQGGDK